MLLTAFCAWGVGLIAPHASASAVLTYNTSIPNPPTCIVGTGCVNSNFTDLKVTNSDGSFIELDLSAILAYLGPIAPVTDTYTAPTGLGSHDRATWDLEYEVYTGCSNGNGVCTTPGVVSANTYNLTIFDTTTGQSTSFDPSAIPDNNCYTTASAVINGNCSGLSNVNAFGNAESPSFAFLATPLKFNPNATDQYQITLSATPKNGAVADPSVTIFVDAAGNVVAPEPGTFLMIGGGLIGLGLVNRRRLARR